MALLTLRQRTFAALTFAARTLHGLVDVAVAAAVGGGGGKKHKRKRVLKKTIYGTVVSVWQEEHHERPPIAIAEEITERVAETYRDIEAEIAEVRRMMQCEAAQILKSSVYRGVYKGNSEPKRLLYARADFFIVTLGNILGH